MGGKFRKVGNEEAGKENLKIKNKTKLKIFIFVAPSTYFPKTIFNPFQSNFSANRILPSSYLFWAVKRLVDYL
jgi:hypothetical protein